MNLLCSFPTTIKTERLTLRPLIDTDRDALVALFRDELVKKTYMLPDLDDDDCANALFVRMKDLSISEQRLVRGICLDDALIGVINDVGVDEDTIEVGYALHSDYHNRAYMTEALSAVISELKLCGFTVRAGAFSENASSIRVMEKCKMRRIEHTETIEYRESEHLCIFYEA